MKHGAQLSLFRQYRPIGAERPPYTIPPGEECTAFGRDIGWVRVTSDDMQQFAIVGGQHDGTTIGREFIWLFHP